MSNDFKQTSFLFGSNSVFLEELYQKYQKDPSSVDSSWKEFFANQNTFTPLKSTATIINQDHPKVENIHRKEASSTDSACSSGAINSLKAKFMIMSYREHGHQLAELDPLGLEVRKTHNELKLNIEDFGFTQNQLSEKVDITGQLSDISVCTIGELFEILQRTYSGSIATEFSHVENSAEQKWLYDQLESANTHATFSNEEKKKALNDLIKIEGFEQYLHTKFSGAKRFSIEGGDTSIICLEAAIDYFSSNGADEAVLGLAHRGRLSTLTKVMQKPYRAVLSEFTGSSAFPANLDISGDVKYHMGYSSDKVTESGNTIHLSLLPNPSHLEAVNPVVAGKVRAKQDYMERDRTKVVGILVHGDAAFCGQGIVAESLVMSGLKPYDIGGIFHLVINNQIGFTANAGDLRPGRYCTEVAKMVGAPIIHVNGDDVESVILATKIACNYREKFAKDVVVDIVCYRKYGHNEGDEPMYTQSVMYNVIKMKKSPAAMYSEKLIGQSVIGEEYYPKLKQEFKSYLDTEFTQIESYEPQVQWLEGIWSGFEKSDSQKPSTGVAESTLKKLCKKLCTIPESFPINSKLKKLLGNRYDSISKDQPLDWAVAEQLAFATLLQDGTAIRITGQDVGRGTFSHRHAVLHSQTDNTTYEPLNNISKDQAFFEIADSNLSEYGVLGFEYGYSLVNPKNLVIWEAQFGDFCNGAQIIFDQFISSSETKWLRMSGLVCLLPHGFEGQGPEHSSARIERFLQLCAEDNMQVVYPTTPASIFHLLRRQMLRNVRKPLIIMSPKSLLRHKLAVSSIKEIDKGTAFAPIIDEIDRNVATNSVKKIIFCSGKVYYDLLEMRRDNNIKDIAIIRLEQLYPFEEGLIVKIMQKYKNVTNYVWCQEEPKNMGCWKYIRPNMESALKEAGIRKTIKFVGRPRSASPAVGYLYVHKKQQESLTKEALAILNK